MRGRTLNVIFTLIRIFCYQKAADESGLAVVTLCTTTVVSTTVAVVVWAGAIVEVVAGRGGYSEGRIAHTQAELGLQDGDETLKDLLLFVGGSHECGDCILNPSLFLHSTYRIGTFISRVGVLHFSVEHSHSTALSPANSSQPIVPFTLAF